MHACCVECLLARNGFLTSVPAACHRRPTPARCSTLHALRALALYSRCSIHACRAQRALRFWPKLCKRCSVRVSHSR